MKKIIDKCFENILKIKIELTETKNKESNNI